MGIDLPIFKWTRDLLRGPEAEVEQCRAEIEAERSRISLEVEDLVERLRAQSSELEYRRQTIEPVFERAVELSERALAAGQADMLPRLTAEAGRLSQQQRSLDRPHSYRRLEIELEQALGKAARP